MSFDIAALLCKLFPFILLTTPAFAEDVIVITADRIKSESTKTSSDVRLISLKEIQQNLSLTLPDLLSKESDIQTASSGQSNSNTSVFLRGTDSSHTLVVLDGIIMNDPGNPNRQFDIGKLSLNNIEKIEILKGSQGLAYGSNAIGGVIVITTKKARSKNLHGEYYANTGSYKTNNAGANFQKKTGRLSTSFGLDVFSSEGFSAANEHLNPRAEKDGSKRITLDLNSNYDLSDQYDAVLLIRYNKTDADLDKGGGAGADDPNDILKEEEFYSKVQLKKSWDSGLAETKLGFNRGQHRRKFEVNYDPLHPDSSVSLSKGVLNDISIEHTYMPAQNLTQNINLSYQHEEDQTGHFNENISAFLYHQLELSKSIFNFGIRIDHNHIFNEHLTFKAAAGQNIQSGLIKISYSTGFRAPSINQLYTPVYGNINLVPETSRSIDLSFDQNWSETFKSSSTLFTIKINDRFSYDPVTFYNINRGSAEILGLEQNLHQKWGQSLSQSLGLTLLKTRDLSRGERLARRPDIKARTSVDYDFNDLHSISYLLSYTGNRTDVDNAGNTVQASAYLLSDLSYTYRLTEKNEFFLKIKNLFNVNYEEVYGFGTGGRSLSAGAHFIF